MELDQLKRRSFITLLGGAAAWPLAARAQEPTFPTIGWLGSTEPNDVVPLAGIRRGLNQTGYVEGKNVLLEYRWAGGRYDRLPHLAADLIRRQVAVILAGGGPAARAAKAATTTIPIVFLVGVDPLVAGLVANINRPDGNATGVNLLSRELNEKKLELLRELLPKAVTIAALVNPSNPSIEIFLEDIKIAASRLGHQVLFLSVRGEGELETTFANLLQRQVDGLVVTDDPLFNILGTQLIGFAERHKIPTIYPWREDVQAGGLISYGPSRADAYRQVGIYAGKILKGARPADLPVLQPTKFETVLNLKTANALGLDVPKQPFCGPTRLSSNCSLATHVAAPAQVSSWHEV